MPRADQRSRGLEALGPRLPRLGTSREVESTTRSTANAMLATDFHHENLIASGEHPVLVDLESLFHPTLRPYRESQLAEAVRNAMSYSVLRTALLPTVHYVGRNATPFEVGGLSDVEGQQTPHAVAYVKMSVEDEAHIDRMRMRMRGSQNVPTLCEVKPDPAAYTEEIVEGFTTLYELLLANREELLGPAGPVHAFAGDSVRFIFRHTRAYSVLARETQHLDLQRNALDRDRDLLRLWALLEEREDIASLIDSEVRSLWRGDVPFFYTRTDSVDLFDHEDRRHPDLLARSCLDEVVGHVWRLSAEDMQRQIWFIRGAIACQQIQEGENGASGRAGRPSFLPASGNDQPARSAFLEAARRIGDRLTELALRGGTEEGEAATWLGMVLRKENAWQLMALGIDLYNGLSGIALFLAYLAKATGESRYSDLARAVLTEIRKQQKTVQHRSSSSWKPAGWGGRRCGRTRSSSWRPVSSKVCESRAGSAARRAASRRPG